MTNKYCNFLAVGLNTIADYVVMVSFLVGKQTKGARRYQGCTNSNWCGIFVRVRHNGCIYSIWVELGQGCI